MPEDRGDRRLEEQVRSHSQKIEDLQESMRKVSGPYSQLLEYIERFQKISSSYFRLLDLYQRHGTISPDILIPGVRDTISRDIVKVLFEKDGQNISQIADKLKELRGSSSRRIVRERLKKLEEKGVVRAKGSSRSREYWMAQEYIDKWYEILGLGPKKD
jgi:DNA-binding transcriptional ArsR family regulator